MAKRTHGIIHSAFVLVLAAGTADAALVDRGNGMIFDTVLNITWLQDVAYSRTSGADVDGVFNFDNANSWASNLVYGGLDDWRLPTLQPVNGTNFSSVDAGARYNGSSDYGFNIAYPGRGVSDPPAVNPYFEGNELAYMFYVNLGNLAQYDVDGTQRPGLEGADWGLVNTSFVDGLTGKRVAFLNLKYEDVFDGFWTNTEVNSQYGWAFLFRGFNDAAFKTYWAGAWAVRDGDVATPPATVPEPSSFALILSGILPGLWLIVRRVRS